MTTLCIAVVVSLLSPVLLMFAALGLEGTASCLAWARRKVPRTPWTARKIARTFGFEAAVGLAAGIITRDAVIAVTGSVCLMGLAMLRAAHRVIRAYETDGDL